MLTRRSLDLAQEHAHQESGSIRCYLQVLLSVRDPRIRANLKMFRFFSDPSQRYTPVYTTRDRSFRLSTASTLTITRGPQCRLTETLESMFDFSTVAASTWKIRPFGRGRSPVYPVNRVNLVLSLLTAYRSVDKALGRVSLTSTN